MTVQLHEILWDTSLLMGRRNSLQRGKALLVYFSLAPACEPCVEFEEEALNQDDVVNFVEKYFQPVKLNLKRDRLLADGYEVTKTPTLVVIDEHNQVQHRIEGQITAKELLGQLSLGLGKLWLDHEWFEKSRSRLEKVIQRHPGTQAADEAEYWKHVGQRRQDDGLVEEAIKESFPASDPPCWTLGRENKT